MSAIAEVWAEAGNMLYRRGHRNIKGTVVTETVGPWKVTVNATDETVDDYLPPLNIAVEFNGWPAGVIGPDGGVIAAGRLANEEAFIAAMKADGKGEADGR